MNSRGARIFLSSVRVAFFGLALPALLLGASYLPGQARQAVSASARLTAAPGDRAPASAALAGSAVPIRLATTGVFTPEPASGPALLHLGAGYTLDLSQPGFEQALPSELKSAPPAAGERGYFLVQFKGPISEEDRKSLEERGARILNYIPDYAFLVSMISADEGKLSTWERIAGSCLYQPAYKMSTLSQMKEPGSREFVVLLFPDASLPEAETALAAAGATIRETSDSGVNKMLKVTLDSALLPAAARIPAIAWIEPFQVPQLYNDSAQWVVQTWSSGSRRLWDLGIKGQGQVITLADSGIRTTHYQFYDSAHPITTFGDYTTHRKIIAYKKTLDSTTITFGDESINSYHGTHTSCTAAGDDSPNAADARDGMAINAKIYFLDGGAASTSGINVPIDLNTMFIMPYTGNAAGAARISSCSWGTSNGGVYDTQCMAADQFMWNHPDFLAFFSNGNDGTTNSVGSPAAAKNVVSAGGTGDGSSANTIYSSTSRGPTDDNRIKPTICSPATLSSAYGSGNTGYVTYSGTSMASPSMAGATILLRQYLTDGWYPTGAAVPANTMADPSAALLKAMAINSADPDVSGYTVPDNNIGWGRIDDDAVAYFSGDTRRLALVDNTTGLITGEYVEYQVYVAANTIPLKATLVWTDYPGTPSAAIELVNDLNLTASDGATTYKGNVYSGGQSTTGGTADSRNVEECVRRNTPTVGLWTFRVEAVNAPMGPQPFALVVTGALASDQGIVTLDKPTYGGSDALGIRVVDTNAGASVTVNVASTTEPSGESLVLSGSNGVYAGTFPLSLGYPTSGDGLLEVSSGDQIAVTYVDDAPVLSLTAHAAVDLIGPTITGVHASAINETDATVAWTTSAPASSKVYYGTTPALGLESALNSTLATAHAVPLAPLSAGALYYYDVESLDHQGNAVRDDNGGAHYTFTTDNTRDVLLVIGDATFGQTAYYQAAFARSGWSYTIWSGNSAAVPYVGNLSGGMAAYKAVVWQTGTEQYPMFTDAARDSIARLDLLGSRLAVFSHDVAWDFSDATNSPDYSAARLAWFNNELKATWQVDPSTFSSLLGYTSDPISGSYTAGISYTPIRSGAAGDEVNGIATGGSFSNVWKDNSTPDDVAIRWTSSANVGDPAKAVWGGTPRKVSSNFFEWAQINAATTDDATRSDVLDKTLIWLVGHDHPAATVTAPNGGESYTGDSANITWTESADTGYSITSRKIYLSGDGGDTWVLLTSTPGPSPFTWDLTTVPNGAQYRVKVVVTDNATPALSGFDASNANFTVNRPGGDTRGPLVVAGSLSSTPDPILVPNSATLTAIVSDAATGNSNIAAAEWSVGATPAPAGSGTAMSGTFTSPTVTVTAALDSGTLPVPQTILWVRGQDAAGQWGNASSVTVPVNAPLAGVETGLPARFALFGGAPNPSRGETAVRFALPRTTRLLLEIFDVTGRRIRTLADGPAEAGVRSLAWNGRDLNGKEAGSGIYFAKMQAEGFTAVRKITLLR